MALAREQAWVDFGLHVNIRGEVDGKVAAIPELVEEGRLTVEEPKGELVRRYLGNLS